MLKRRFFSNLFFAIAVLFAQQGGAMHALRHILAEQAQQQQKKQGSPTHECEQCISYAQIGGALNSSYLTLALLTALTHTLTQHQVVFHSLLPLTATARGPPSLQSPV
jgi:hypothetical protein